MRIFIVTGLIILALVAVLLFPKLQQQRSPSPPPSTTAVNAALDPPSSAPASPSSPEQEAEKAVASSPAAPQSESPVVSCPASLRFLASLDSNANSSSFRDAMRNIIVDSSFRHVCAMRQTPAMNAALLGSFERIRIVRAHPSACQGYILVQSEIQRPGPCKVPVPVVPNASEFNADNELIQHWSGPDAFECSVLETLAKKNQSKGDHQQQQSRNTRLRACEPAVHDPSQCGRYMIPFDLSDWCGGGGEAAQAVFYVRQVWSQFDAMNDAVPELPLHRYLKTDFAGQHVKCKCAARRDNAAAPVLGSYSWITWALPTISSSTSSSSPNAASNKRRAQKQLTEELQQISSRFAWPKWRGSSSSTKTRYAPYPNIELALLRPYLKVVGDADSLALSPRGRVTWWNQVFPKLAADWAGSRSSNQRAADVFHALWLGDSQPRTMFRRHEAVVCNKPSSKAKAYLTSTFAHPETCSRKHIASFVLDNFLKRLLDRNESWAWFGVADDMDARRREAGDNMTESNFFLFTPPPQLVLISIGPWPASVGQWSCSQFHETMVQLRDTIRVIQKRQRHNKIPVTRFVWLGPVAWPKPRKGAHGQVLAGFRVTNERLRLYGQLGHDVLGRMMTADGDDVLSIANAPWRWTAGVMKWQSLPDKMHYPDSVLFEVLRNIFEMVLA